MGVRSNERVVSKIDAGSIRLPRGTSRTTPVEAEGVPLIGAIKVKEELETHEHQSMNH